MHSSWRTAHGAAAGDLHGPDIGIEHLLTGAGTPGPTFRPGSRRQYGGRLEGQAEQAPTVGREDLAAKP
ncbi:hypothetical protein GCM10010254_21540 [Streptomyces chromofuscus]|nr:hypothetical protein GCM10010254_21540 [Streptomyces chromofuscus]